ncbi:MAG: hypothetical protein J6Y68_02715 [Clostridia bacterium]|nr:hypothetical protein [Clostridia bacterium]
MTEEAKKRASQCNANYKKRNSVQVELRLYRTAHSDVIARLESIPSKKQYIVELIRKDIAENPTPVISAVKE